MLSGPCRIIEAGRVVLAQRVTQQDARNLTPNTKYPLSDSTASLPAPPVRHVGPYFIPDIRYPEFDSALLGKLTLNLFKLFQHRVSWMNGALQSFEFYWPLGSVSFVNIWSTNQQLIISIAIIIQLVLWFFVFFFIVIILFI